MSQQQQSPQSPADSSQESTTSNTIIFNAQNNGEKNGEKISGERQEIISDHTLPYKRVSSISEWIESGSNNLKSGFAGILDCRYEEKGY